MATLPSGESLLLEVAERPHERARGLMGRAHVPHGAGMYFRFPEAGRHAFWMFGCLVPLDIAWLDAAGTVVHVEAAAPPCAAQPCPSYAPDAPATQVIELAAGEAGRIGLHPGVRVLLRRLPPREGRP